MAYNKELLRCIPCDDLVRLGRNKDGGYILPARLLNRSEALISGGVFTDWSFEKDFIKSSLIKDYLLVDRNTSIKGMARNLYKDLNSKKISLIVKIKCFIHFVYNLPRVFIMRRVLKKKFIESFIVASNKEVSLKREDVTINNLIDKLEGYKKNNRIFLKLDIEGSEWDVIDDIIDKLDYFSGIAIEVHSLDLFGNKLENFIKVLNHKGVLLVHVHPNNNGGFCRGTLLPKLLELTFISSCYLTKNEKTIEKLKPFSYNYNLDRPCDPSTKEMIIN